MLVYVILVAVVAVVVLATRDGGLTTPDSDNTLADPWTLLNDRGAA